MTLAADDLAAFVDEDMPGYVLASIGGSDVPGLFRAPYSGAFGLVASSAPEIMVLTADATGVTVGTSVTVPAGTYTVAEVQPTGNGLTRLVFKP